TASRSSCRAPTRSGAAASSSSSTAPTTSTSSTRGTPASTRSPPPSSELVLDLAEVDARDREQDVEVEEHVRRLLHQPAVACRRRDRGLDRLLAELLSCARDARIGERSHVRAVGPLAHALDHRPPERRREARGRAGVACGTGG